MSGLIGKISILIWVAVEPIQVGGNRPSEAPISGTRGRSLIPADQPHSSDNVSRLAGSGSQPDLTTRETRTHCFHQQPRFHSPRLRRQTPICTLHVVLLRKTRLARQALYQRLRSSCPRQSPKIFGAVHRVSFSVKIKLMRQAETMRNTLVTSSHRFLQQEPSARPKS